MGVRVCLQVYEGGVAMPPTTIRWTIRNPEVNGLVSRLVHENLSWGPLQIDVTWYAEVKWERSCSLDRCNSILFLDICWADAASARLSGQLGVQSIVFNPFSTNPFSAP